MALDPNRWTLKTTEAFAAATEAARSASHAEVTPDHLLIALLAQTEGLVLPMLHSAGVDHSAVLARSQQAVAVLPRAYGSDVGVSRELHDVLTGADKLRLDLGEGLLVGPLFREIEVGTLLFGSEAMVVREVADHIPRLFGAEADVAGADHADHRDLPAFGRLPLPGDPGHSARVIGRVATAARRLDERAFDGDAVFRFRGAGKPDQRNGGNRDSGSHSGESVYQPVDRVT